MRRILRYALTALKALIVVLLVGLAALYLLSRYQLTRTYSVPVQALTLPADPAALERGRHLAEHVTGCRDCHGSDYGGRMFLDLGMLVARIAGPNLTRGQGGVGSRYTDADWIRATVHGVAPDGRALVLMPSHEFAKLPAPDVAALIAYVKSVPPVDRTMPAPTIGPVGRGMVLFNASVLPARVIDHARPLAAAAPTDLVARGDQLASVAGCKGCHSPDLTGAAGPPPGPTNITPVGIGTWTKEDFIRSLKTGRTPDGRVLAETMPRAFGQMTDEELDAIWAYLRTVPPKGEKAARQGSGGGRPAS